MLEEHAIRSLLREHEERLFDRMTVWLEEQQDKFICSTGIPLRTSVSTAEGNDPGDSVHDLDPVRSAKQTASDCTSRLSAKKSRDTLNDDTHRWKAARISQSVQSAENRFSLRNSIDTTSPIRATLQRVVMSNMFEVFFGFLIISNAVLLGVQVEYAALNSRRAAPLAITIMQNVYTALFFVEMILRMVSEGLYDYFYAGSHVYWNLTDVLIVGFSLIEVAADLIGQMDSGAGFASAGNVRSLRVIRITRLVRVLRIVRLVRFVRGLRCLVYSVIATLKSLLWALLLMFMVLYMFGLIFTDSVVGLLSEKYKPFSSSAILLEQSFGGIHRSIHTLFRCVSGGTNWDVLADAVLAELGFPMFYMFAFFICFTVFAVLNVMTGVFCQSAIEGAAKDSEVMAQKIAAEAKRNRQMMTELFESAKSVHRDCLSLDLIVEHLQRPAFRTFLSMMDLEPQDAWTLFQFLDKDKNGDVTLEEFVEGLSNLRGPARSIDVAVIGRDCTRIKRATKELDVQIMDMHRHLHRVETAIAQGGQMKNKHRVDSSVVSGSAVSHHGIQTLPESLSL